ncbi:cupin domain-containing protein [Endozoicomonas sp. 4G]|uniref:cupin domain-containing protein n=1 Tax=Endozoicomonas sp. 4G TaxID=2872754 RepID=UPI002078D354|nr:cupin domain-containing protein [Endozoicomonas sp. 4G]
MSSITNIKEALAQAKKDESVGISIATLSSGQDFCLFCTEIPKGHKVGCRYHIEGDEIYSILSGEGVIYTAAPDKIEDANSINFRPVVAGDNFTIPAGVVHQLKASSDMVLLFICPQSHLNSDRVIVPSLTT